MRDQGVFAGALAGAMYLMTFSAQAELLTYQFSGTITSVEELDGLPEPLQFPIRVGQLISGTLFYDSEFTPGSTAVESENGRPIVRVYGGANVEAFFAIADGPTFSEVAVVFIANDLRQANNSIHHPGGYGIDAFTVAQEPIHSDELPIPPPSPYVFQAFVHLADTSRAVFGSIQLPVAVPLPSFDLSSFEIWVSHLDGTPTRRYLIASIRSFTRVGPEVQLDIRPGDNQNVIDRKSSNTVPVAVLTGALVGSSTVFDAADINPLSVRMGGLGRDAPPVRYLRTDVDADGDKDLLLWFRSRDFGFICKDMTATLRAQTLGDAVVQGTDRITLAGCE